MGVVITFQPAGLTGRVAKQIDLTTAACRMGLQFGRACSVEGNCNGCIVIVRKGESLLSAPTEKEFRLLGAELMQSRRMACQAFVEKDGELVVEITESNPMKNDATKDVRKEFADLPLSKKLTTLMQLEVATVMDAFNEISNRSSALAEKLFEKLEERKKSGPGNK